MTERKSSTAKRLLMTAAALTVLATGSWYGNEWYRHGRFEQSTDDAYVGADVTVIAPKVPGLIDSVLVTDNQSVHAGDLLIRIDDREYRAELAAAEAAVAAQQAAIGNIAARRTLQLSVIAQAKAGLSGTQADYTKARKDRQRNFSVAYSGAVSGQTLDHVEADLQRAGAEESRARAAVAAAENEIGVLDSEERQAETALNQAIARRDLAKLNVGYTELRAPIDGVIGNRSAKTGAYAGAGASLISLVPAHGLWVDANFKESQLAAMKPGQAAHIVADVAPGREFKGTVQSLAPATGAQFSILPPENATGNFTKIVQRVPVRIALDGADADLGWLRPGLSVTVSIDERAPAAATPSIQGGSHDQLTRR
jgi:membrane fusion protein (multidrug efflux system)